MASATVQVEWHDHSVKIDVDLSEVHNADWQIIAGGPLAALAEAVERTRAAIAAIAAEVEG